MSSRSLPTRGGLGRCLCLALPHGLMSSPKICNTVSVPGCMNPLELAEGG